MVAGRRWVCAPFSVVRRPFHAWPILLIVADEFIVTLNHCGDSDERGLSSIKATGGGREDRDNTKHKGGVCVGVQIATQVGGCLLARAPSSFPAPCTGVRLRWCGTCCSVDVFCFVSGCITTISSSNCSPSSTTSALAVGQCGCWCRALIRPPSSRRRMMGPPLCGGP